MWIQRKNLAVAAQSICMYLVKRDSSPYGFAISCILGRGTERELPFFFP